MRSASALLRPYNPAQDVLVFGGVSCVDYGDAPTVPGYIEDTLERIAAYVTTIHRGGAIALGIGGVASSPVLVGAVDRKSVV